MSTLSLDFSDASFDQDDIYRIDGDGFVYEMHDATGSQQQAMMTSTSVQYTDKNGNPVNNGTGLTAGGVSAVALTLPPGAVFDFEFVDTDGHDQGQTGDLAADQYKLSVSGMSGHPSQDFYISEQYIDGQLTNQGQMAISTTSVMDPVGTRSINFTTPRQVTDHGVTTTTHNAVELIVNVNNATTPATISFSARTDGGGANVQITETSAIAAFNAETGGSVSDAAGLAAAIWSETRTDIVGDLGGDVFGTAVNWVVSGDINGRDATSSDDYIGFRPGYYDGVFEGGGGFDTLVFEHYDMPGQPASQMYVALDAGFAYMHGTPSPIVQFAKQQASYEIDWERLEIRGDSNDTVTVGGGLEDEAHNTDVSVDANGNLVDYFQMDLGSGDDRVEIYESDNLIELDLSSTADHTVTLSTSAGEFSLLSSGFELGMDGRTQLDTGATPTVVTGDSSSLSVRGTDTADATIDYISFGQGTNNTVDNNSDQGIVVNFGSADDRYGSGDSFLGKDANDGSKIGADIIDLRNETNVSISDGDQTAASSISITAAGGVDISATNADVLLVSDGSGDEDYLVNKEYLYGTGKGVFGSDTISDINGDGFDVITSARLDAFDGNTDIQIFYDGDHTDFVDTKDDDAFTVDLAANTVTVGTTIDAEQAAWEGQVEGSGSVNPNGNTPTFYIEVSGNKVAVHYDDIDGTWKVDTSAFEISSNSTISAGTKAAAAEANIKANYGIDVAGKLTGITSGDVYLNATETDIADLLANYSLSSPAHNFSYYTQIVGQDANGNNVQVNVALEGAPASWEISDNDVLVETSYNTETFGAGDTAVAGSSAADFIEMGANANGGIAMGNGGDDVYQVDHATDGGLVYEIGGIMDNGGTHLAGSDDDTIQFELAEEMFDLDLSRGRIAGERADSTLFVDGTASGSGQATLFDQYNDFAFFRQTEYLMIDDGATANEIFEIADGTDISAWDNEVYVADSSGGSITMASGGGVDHVFFGSGADTVDLGSMMHTGDSVTVHNLGSGDSVLFRGQEYATQSADSVEVSYSGAGKHLIEYYDAAGIELNAMEIELAALAK